MSAVKSGKQSFKHLSLKLSLLMPGVDSDKYDGVTVKQGNSAFHGKLSGGAKRSQCFIASSRKITEIEYSGADRFLHIAQDI